MLQFLMPIFIWAFSFFICFARLSGFPSRFLFLCFGSFLGITMLQDRCVRVYRGMVDPPDLGIIFVLSVKLFPVSEALQFTSSGPVS